MGREDYSDPQTQLQSTHLMRFLLGYYLNGVPLQTRKILIDLRQLYQKGKLVPVFPTLFYEL